MCDPVWNIFSHGRKSGHQEGRGYLPKEKMKFRVNCFFAVLTEGWEENNLGNSQENGLGRCCDVFVFEFSFKRRRDAS